MTESAVRIENRRLKLRPHTPISVPAEFHTFYVQIKEGFSIAQIAMGLKVAFGEQRFASLARFLIFLSDRGLLLDPDAERLVESLRHDESWPEGMAFEKLTSIEIFRLAKRLPNKALSSFTLFLLGSFALLSVFSFVKAAPFHLAFFQPGDPAGAVAWSWLLTYAAVFCVGQSVLGLCRLVTTYCTANYNSPLSLRIEPTAVYLDSDGISQTNGGEITLGCGLFSIFTLLSPSFFVGHLPDVKAGLYFTELLFLVGCSPFVKSAFNDWLRAVYNFLTPTERRDPELDGFVKNLQLASCVLWTGCLAFFIVYRTKPAFQFFKATLTENQEGFGAKFSFALLVLLHLMLFVSLLNDVLSAIVQGGGNDLLQIRKVWRRKPPRLSVDEAIAQGRSPERGELAKLPLLRQLDTQLRDQLLENSRLMLLAEGQAACRQDGSDRSLFILLSGEVAVAKRIRGKRRVVALLSDGSIFGEAAFFLGQKRTADVIALKPCVVLEIAHRPGLRALDQDRSEALQSRIWFLQALVSGSLFRDLPSEALDALIFAGRERKLPAGVHPIREGGDAEACYFIIQGQATITQNGKVINKLKAGDVFGEIGLLRPLSPRTASVIADSDLLTIAITVDDFWNLLSAHLSLAVEIERIAESRLLADKVRAEKERSKKSV